MRTVEKLQKLFSLINDRIAYCYISYLFYGAADSFLCHSYVLVTHTVLIVIYFMVLLTGLSSPTLMYLPHTLF
jgi:hypothetical protein